MIQTTEPSKSKAQQFTNTSHNQTSIILQASGAQHNTNIPTTEAISNTMHNQTLASMAWWMGAQLCNPPVGRTHVYEQMLHIIYALGQAGADAPHSLRGCTSSEQNNRSARQSHPTQPNTNQPHTLTHPRTSENRHTAQTQAQPTTQTPMQPNVQTLGNAKEHQKNTQPDKQKQNQKHTHTHTHTHTNTHTHTHTKRNANAIKHKPKHIHHDPRPVQIPLPSVATQASQPRAIRGDRQQVARCPHSAPSKPRNHNRGLRSVEAIARRRQKQTEQTKED